MKKSRWAAVLIVGCVIALGFAVEAYPIVVSGTVRDDGGAPMGGVQIYVDGAFKTTTDANGEYSFLVYLPSGTFEPRHFQTEFDPPFRYYHDFNLQNQDFVGWQWVSISGYVKRPDDTGINGVFMNAFDSDGNPIEGEDLTTNMGGFYQFRVSLALNLTVTPELAGYTFVPDTMFYPSATVNYIEQNYTGTEGTGILHPESGSVPDGFRLYPNHPNPFNPETIIRYDLPEPGEVTLSVYNLVGHAVVRLVDGNQEAGQYTAIWNGTDERGNPVPSGVYLMHIKASKFSQTRKMILSR